MGVRPLKLITFAVPCYNSAAYMDHCIQTLLPAGEEAEIILIDDGSTDDTGAIADRWAAAYPDLVRVIHQENGGHGEGVNQGLRHAEGLYYKVVDSDDWLDEDALKALMDQLRASARREAPVDLFVCNYVYEHVSDGSHHVVRYKNALTPGKVLTWNEIGRFRASQFMIMHAAVYRTQVLRDSGIVLPRHTFYVDNVFVYVPLPSVKTLCYLDIDLYRYFIGRADQSVTEENMMRRIDQQIRITRIMTDAHDLDAVALQSRRLARYMAHFLSIMLMICNIYLLKAGDPQSLEKRDRLWADLKAENPKLYRRMRYRSANVLFLLPGRGGRAVILAMYRVLRKIYKFN